MITREKKSLYDKKYRESEKYKESQKTDHRKKYLKQYGKRKWKMISQDKKDIAKQRVKDRYWKIRLTALDMLGNKCVKCGFSDIRALQIDHINGGGNIERKNKKKDMDSIVIESFLKNEHKYQLLCANCNWIKKSENNENRRSN